MPVVAFAVFAAVAASCVASTAALAANVKQAKRDKFAFFDSRQSTAAQKVLRGRAAKLDAEPSAAVASLRESLGNEGVVSIDPLTSTARVVARTDGFLTGSSSARPLRSRWGTSPPTRPPSASPRATSAR